MLSSCLQWRLQKIISLLCPLSRNFCGLFLRIRFGILDWKIAGIFRWFFFWSPSSTEWSTKNSSKKLGRNSEQSSGQNSGRKFEKFRELSFCDFSDLIFFPPKTVYNNFVPNGIVSELRPDVNLAPKNVSHQDAPNVRFVWRVLSRSAKISSRRHHKLERATWLLRRQKPNANFWKWLKESPEDKNFRKPLRRKQPSAKILKISRNTLKSGRSDIFYLLRHHLKYPRSFRSFLPFAFFPSA